jgi:hypothetical protein
MMKFSDPSTFIIPCSIFDIQHTFKMAYFQARETDID